jgi:hypothetical protein
VFAKEYFSLNRKEAAPTSIVAPRWLQFTCFVSAGVLPVTIILYLIVGIVEYAALSAGRIEPFALIAMAMAMSLTIGAILWNSYCACFRARATAAWIVVVVSATLGGMSIAFVQHDLGMWAWQMSLAGSLFGYYLITVCLLHARLAYLNQRAGSVSYKHVRGRIFGARA